MVAILLCVAFLRYTPRALSREPLEILPFRPQVRCVVRSIDGCLPITPDLLPYTTCMIVQDRYRLPTTDPLWRACLVGTVSFMVSNRSKKCNTKRSLLTTNVKIQCNRIETGLLLALGVCNRLFFEKPYFLLLPVNSQSHHFTRFVQLIRSRWLTPIKVPL